MEKTQESTQILDSLYEQTMLELNQKAAWYTRHKWYHSIGSTVSRMAGLVALGYGLAMPYFMAEPNYKLGASALVLGGFLVLCDQVLMMSASWARYSAAELSIKAVAEHLKADWQVLEISDREDVSSAEISRANLLPKALKSANDIQVAETTKWQGELNSAIKTLRDRLAAEQVKSEQKLISASKEGGLNLRLTTSRSAQESVTVSIEGVEGTTRTASQLPTTIGYSGLPAGIHMVHVQVGDGDKQPTAKFAIKISENSIIEKEFSID